MIQSYNVVVDFDQIPEPDTRKRCLAKAMIKRWNSQEDFDAGLPPDEISVDAEEFLLTAEEASAIQKQCEQLSNGTIRGQ